MEQTHLYSSHHNVNLLTAALLAHNIRHIVVCPGSRNAPIVHNLVVNGEFFLHAVTDERSAAFVALGVCLKQREGAALCVTSGSALLNTLPGVAEAAFRHLPLLVISADRPAEFHGILDGQTLPQVGALEPYASTWQVAESSPCDDLSTREALAGAFAQFVSSPCRVVHLNCPIAEPLFTFDVRDLPAFPITAPSLIACESDGLVEKWKSELVKAELPAMVIGEMEDDAISEIVNRLRSENKMLVYAECLSQCRDHRLALWVDQHDEVVPDVVIHLGGCFVNKQFKLRLRTTSRTKVLRIDERFANAIGENDKMHCPDTFFKQPDWLRTPEVLKTIECLTAELSENTRIRAIHAQLQPAAAVSLPCEAVFVGNSRTIRVVNRHWPVVDFPIYGNRGTNGIEGSLSVAAGYSLVSAGNVLCILGDLSFFYDVNALWNRQLDGRLRILLLNNGRGDIFYGLPGLSASPALTDYVAAAHQTSARGIAESYHCIYQSASADTMEEALDLYATPLLQQTADRPILFEIFIS